MPIREVSPKTGFRSLDQVCYYPPYDTPTFCAELPVVSAEFYNAGMQDIRAAVTLAVDTESDDTAADRIRYNGKAYAIYRRYTTPDGLTELYLTEKAGVT